MDTGHGRFVGMSILPGDIPEDSGSDLEEVSESEETYDASRETSLVLVTRNVRGQFDV